MGLVKEMIWRRFARTRECRLISARLSRSYRVIIAKKKIYFFSISQLRVTKFGVYVEYLRTALPSDISKKLIAEPTTIKSAVVDGVT